MKRIPPLCLGLLASASLWAQQAVLYTGSDRNDAEAPLREVWSTPEFMKAAGVTLEMVDSPKNVDDAVKATWKKQKKIRISPKHIPAFAWFDAKGRCVLLREGLYAKDSTEASQTLNALLNEGRIRERQVTELLSRGTAEAAVEALALVIPEIGVHRSRKANGLKDAWDILEAKDCKGDAVFVFAPTLNLAIDCDKAKSLLNPSPDKALSQAEIQRLLNAGAKSGNRNQVPPNEASRCYGVIARAFREKCNAYGLESSPTGRDPVLTVTFGSGGSIRNIAVKTSSGDSGYDRQVHQACRQVRKVDGLSSTFLASYKTVDIRLSVE